jgi:hypothetical protein
MKSPLDCASNAGIYDAAAGSEENPNQLHPTRDSNT